MQNINIFEGLSIMHRLLILLITIMFNINSISCSSITSNDSDPILYEENEHETKSKYEEIEINPIPGLDNNFIRGMDVSMLKQIEENGGKFYDQGEEKDALRILKDHGVNYIRLRLWNAPEEKGGGDCDLATVKTLAKRAKNLDMKFLLDFHYSDFWADPGKQNKPEAWKTLTFEELKDSLYSFTYNSLMELKKAGTLPNMVQIGNELNNGMLWPDGKLWTDSGKEIGGFDNFSELLKSGLKAVEAISPDIQTMIHLADGGDNDLYRWIFDEIAARGVSNFDIIGLSYYPYWHGTFEEFKNNINDISQRYDKEVAVVETGYGYTLENGDDLGNIFYQEQLDIVDEFDGVDDNDYPASIQSQAAIIRKIMKIVHAVPEQKGQGVFYWEGEWIPVDGAGWKTGKGNAWENQAMFDFKGNVLPSLDVFNKVLDK